MRIVTDSRSVEEPKDPERCNVFALYRLFATEEERAAMEARYRAGGMGYAVAKQALADKFEAWFAPMRRRREELASRPDEVEAVLKRGAERARALARATLAAARRAVGLE